MATPLSILFSFPLPGPTSVNPYTITLAEHVRDAGLRVLYFDWRTALLGDYDVFHVHWPENLVGGRTPLRRLVRQVLTVLIVLRLAATRRGLVRTLHNLELPDGLSRSQRAVLRLIDRRTDVFIRLNEFTPAPRAAEVRTIAHPHYRDWFHGFERSEPIEGRVGFAGRIRRYKGVESLIGAVSTLHPRHAVTARIAGYPSAGLAESITELASDDPRIELEFGFVSDAALVELVTSSELVVLPYRLMHNSGAALVALSLDRPVLVPRNPVTIALGLEAGEGWVHTYTGELESADIADALAAVRDGVRDVRPRLDSRSWDRATEAHIHAYARALGLARRRGRV